MKERNSDWKLRSTANYDGLFGANGIGLPILQNGKKMSLLRKIGMATSLFQQKKDDPKALNKKRKKKQIVFIKKLSKFSS